MQKLDFTVTYTTLNVENTTVTPAVLIITNQSTVGVGRQGGLAGTRQAEEDSDISVLALVGRGVQRQDVVLDGHLVEENGENTLLHLSGVLSTEDDHFLLGKVDGDRGAEVMPSVYLLAGKEPAL